MKKLLLLISTLAAALGARADIDTDELYRFRVLLDDREIGRHEFRIDRDASGTERILIDADFDVRFLRIPVYSYRHRNEEIWRDGCLRRLDAFTDDNGERSRIRVFEQTDGMADERNGEAVRYSARCARSFAYWDRDFVTSSQLLNAQTGQLVEVDIRPVSERPAINLDPATLEGYSIRATDDSLRINVWYERDSGRWVALESILDNDKVLRYLPDTGTAS